MFFDAEMCHCHCDVSKHAQMNFFFDGTETFVCMFICASNLAFDGTPSESKKNSVGNVQVQYT